MKNTELIQEAVLPITEWFAANGKSFPWRESPTPYHVWVSEIMLQQTRISAALPYYLRFTGELPDVDALAHVQDDRLMKLWEGLGYYSRARNLKKAAQTLCEQYASELPEDFEALRKLSGIGDYTAGAIASIAFGLPVPAVDGNVLRVLTRLTASDDDVALQKTKDLVTEELKKIYPRGKEASLLTQGLMEVGEVVCLPNGAPLCDSCPVNHLCLAHKKHTECDYPKKSPKKERRVEERSVLLLRYKDKYALEKRGEKGLLAGLWQFPNLKKTTENELLSYLEQCNIRAEKLSPVGSATHIFTHIEWRMDGFEALCDNPSPCFVWKTREEILQETPLPSAFRFFVKKLR